MHENAAAIIKTQYLCHVYHLFIDFDILSWASLKLLERKKCKYSVIKENFPETNLDPRISWSQFYVSVLCHWQNIKCPTKRLVLGKRKEMHFLIGYQFFTTEIQSVRCQRHNMRLWGAAKQSLVGESTHKYTTTNQSREKHTKKLQQKANSK